MGIFSNRVILKTYIFDIHRVLEGYESSTRKDTRANSLPLILVCLCTSFLFLLSFPLLFDMFDLKADEAARESRQSKQDRYTEMRRRKDEEREARESALVS